MNMSFKTISVIGLGYIGLPTAAMFAAQKKKVIGIDQNQNRREDSESPNIWGQKGCKRWRSWRSIF